MKSRHAQSCCFSLPRRTRLIKQETKELNQVTEECKVCVVGHLLFSSVFTCLISVDIKPSALFSIHMVLFRLFLILINQLETADTPRPFLAKKGMRIYMRNFRKLKNASQYKTTKTSLGALCCLGFLCFSSLVSGLPVAEQF